VRRDGTLSGSAAQLLAVGAYGGRRLMRAVTITVCVCMSGCSTNFTASRPAEYFAAGAGALESDGSLFGADTEVLSDAEIARILDFRYSPPPLSRIALLPFGWGTWTRWSQEMANSAAAVDAHVLTALRASPKIYDASILPSILVPDQRTVPHLREAAARYQADLLLVFRSACQTFEQFRLLQSDRARAYCAIEAVLLDIRTGLVPFVATSTQNYEVVETDADLNFRETLLRSQLDAIGSGLTEVAQAIAQFIESDGEPRR